MTIKTKVQREEIVETELVCPAWFRVDFYGDTKMYQVNSETDIIEVNFHSRSTSIGRVPIGYLPQPEKIFLGERITEQEFNQAVWDAYLKITNDTNIFSSVTPIPTLLSIAV